MLLAVMTISSLSLFSQNVTPSQEFIKIPVPVVRKIVVDLVKGDSAMAQLNQSKLMIEELDNKTKVQDSIIVNYRQVDGNNQKIILNLERKVEIIEGEFKSVSKELKKQKVKARFTNIMSSVAILTLLVFILK
jgi:alpha-amylase/alpha-mannosidase (GH57 family)